MEVQINDNLSGKIIRIRKRLLVMLLLKRTFLHVNSVVTLIQKNIIGVLVLVLVVKKLIIRLRVV